MERQERKELTFVYSIKTRNITDNSTVFSLYEEKHKLIQFIRQTLHQNI